jgi:hypothetical protein
VDETKAGTVYQWTQAALKAATKVQALDFKLPGWPAIASDLVVKVRDAYTAAHKAMRAALIPKEEEIQRIREEWRPVLETFSQLRATLDNHLARHLKEQKEEAEKEQLRQQREKEEAQAALDKALADSAAAETPEEKQEAIAAGTAALQRQEKASAALAAPAASAPEVRGSGGVTKPKEDWHFEVEDISQVPDQYTYRAVDEGLVLGAIKVMAKRKQVPKIAGLKIWSTTKPSTRKAR